MALPTTFANLTSATGAELDNNFAALGACAPIPCTVAGANTLALTQAANTPTVGAYVQGQIYSGIAAQSNSGAVTAQLGSLAALSVYKDTASGPAVLISGDIIQKNVVDLQYDAALNTGAGGFHLLSRLWFATPAGTTAQYVRGDGTLATLNQAAVAGLTTADSPTFSGVTVSTNNGLKTTNQTSGAAASAGTLTNAPSAGNPGFWLPVTVNGVSRFVPAW